MAVVRRSPLFGLVFIVVWVSTARPVTARPLEEASPAQVIGLDPDTPDMALLRWQREEGATYRYCFSTSYTFTDFVLCYDVGMADAWSIRVPQDDGAVFYLSLQACRDGDCADPVRAGAVGRRVRDGMDFYATEFLQPDGRVRLGGFARSGPLALRYYRAAAGTADQLDLSCPQVGPDEVCAAATVGIGGAQAGVGARAGAVERGITFQVRAQPTIYFMFDDGTGIVSGGRYVMQNVLDEFGVKGTFFLTGRAMQTYPSAVRALVAGGHRVGNHTWSHPFLTRLSDAAVGGELDLAEQQYRALIPGGTLKPCFRAPNGDFNARVLAVASARGYRQYTQTISSMDYTGISAARIIQNVMNEARDGALVSFHTQETQTAIALRTLIPLLLAEGYQFGLVC